MPEAFSWAMVSVRKALFLMVSQPLSEVSCVGASGTKVAWWGLFFRTNSMKRPSGLPSILNSVFTISFSRGMSAYRICRSSGRGWTVTPCAPKVSQSFASWMRLGRLPPRELRMRAILLMFTLNLVILFVCVFLCKLFRGRSYGGVEFLVI